MYINPATQFKVYKGIPFDSEHNHIRLFTSVGSQTSYFNSKLVRSFTDFTYVRENNVVRLPIVADDIKNCNYCSFKNEGFGTKEFYAFITNIEYRANKTAFITIQIDWVQTFITEWKIGKSYVEREHVSDDTIGLHTVPENLPLGEYIVANELKYDAQKGVALFIVSPGESSVVNGVYTATQVVAGVGNAGNVTDTLAQLEDKPELIAMLTMVAGKMVNGGALTSFTEQVTMGRNTESFIFNGRSYTPVNKKLFVYPYCFVTIDNFCGSSNTLYPENFAGNAGDMQFTINGTPTPKPCMEIYPNNYGGRNDADSESVTYDNFPMCPYGIDTYRAWVSQVVPQAMVSTGANIITGVLSGGVVGAIKPLIGGAVTAAELAVTAEQKKVHSQSMGGTIASAGMNFAKNRVGFRIQYHTIKPEYAEIIDNFFTRFGYKVEVYKVPNINTRADFNYVKTIECSVDGDIPQECLDEVDNMFNKGVTIHHVDF